MLDDLYDPNSAIGKMMASMMPPQVPALAKALGVVNDVVNPMSVPGAPGMGLPVFAGSAGRVMQTAQQHGTVEGGIQALQEMGKILGLPQRVLLSLGGATPEGVEHGGGDFAEHLGMNRHLGEFAAGTLTDPLTYTGLGLAGKGAGLAARAGVKATNPFMQGLGVVAKADASYSKAAEEAATSLIKGIQSGLVPVNKSLGKVFPDLPKWTELANKTKWMGDATQWLEEHHGLDLRGAQTVWTTNGLDALHNMLPTEMRAVVSKSELGDLMKNATSQNMTDWAAATADYAVGVKSGLGIQANGKFLKGYDQFTSWWKRQALGSIGYLGNNLKGGAFMGMLEGVDPRLVARDAWANKGKIWKGDEFDITGAANLSGRTNTPIPSSLAADASASATANAGQAVGAKGQLVGAALGAGAGAYGDEGNPLVGMLVGAGAGASLPHLTNKVRTISQGLETVMRQRAYTKGMSRDLVENLGEIETLLQNALTQPRANGSVPHQNFFDSINNFVKSRGGQVDSTDIANRLANSARTAPGVADQFERQMDDILYKASRAGTDLSHKVHFDYNDLSNVERAAKQVFPFATWYMKALPFFTEQAMTKPGLAEVPVRWMNEAHENREEKGLTARVEGKLPNPIGRVLQSALLGRDVGDVYQNPLENLIPFADLGQGLDKVERSAEKGNYPDAGLNLLEALGLGLNPAIDMATRVAGLRGTDAPAEGINLRAGGAIDALTGVDLNAAGRDAEARLRTNITGREPTDLNEVAVLKRLDEMALKTTGKTISSNDPAVARYVRAKAEQSGPLWDAAQKQVGSERGINALGGFVDSGLRGTVVSPEEEAIREANTNPLIGEEASKAIRSLATAKPKADAPLQTTKAVLDAVDAILAKTGKDLPPALAQRLADPTNENIAWIATQVRLHEEYENPVMGGYRGSGAPEQRRLQNQNAALYTAGQMTDYSKVPQKDILKVALHTGPENDRDMMLAAHPELAAYVSWKKVNPSGNLEQFVAKSKR